VRIATVSTVRTSPKNLRQFVNYHLNSGIDRVFLFFDYPEDGYPVEFEWDDRLTCVKCDDAYWASGSVVDHSTIETRQVHNASNALAWAREEGIDWIVHIDSDELLFAPYGLVRLLDSVGPDTDAITFPTLEAIPSPMYGTHYFEGATYFKDTESRVPFARQTAELILPRAWRYGYFRGHTVGKTAVRVRSQYSGLEIHLPIDQEGRQVPAERSAQGFVLHFDCCTLEDWILKWKRRYDGTGAAAKILSHRRRQFASFVDAYENGSYSSLLREYKRQCYATRYEWACLRTLGLLRKIDLGAKAFSTSPRYS